MGGSSNRTGKPTIVIVHTGEGILNRNDMAAFLERTAGISAHATSDAGGVAAPLVSYDRAAWAAGPTGNNRGLQIELCAFAVMTRDQWLSRNDVTVWIPWLNANRVIRSPYSMLQHTANWTRAVANQYGIPLTKLSASDLRAGKAGICGHADVSAAWGESDHTDPGSNFPWDVFMNLVNEGDDELSWDEKTKTWNGHELSMRDMLRSAQGYAQTLYDMLVPNGDPFGALIFTDNPKTPNEKVLRLRDVFLEMRTNLAAANAKQDALVAAIAALSKDKNITVESIKTIIEEAVKENINITGTVQITGQKPE